MKLTFLDLAIKDFKSFHGRHLLELDQIGAHFLCGRNEDEPRLDPNGAGKSSLWDALCWCLYGGTPRGLRNQDIKPWSGKKDTWVNLAFMVDKQRHSMVRSLSPNKIFLDEKETSQEEIVRLLGIDFNIFTHTVLLGQGMDLFFDLQPRNKMELFSDTLQLERWDDRSSSASDSVNTLVSRELSLSGELQGLQTATYQVDELIVQCQKQIVSWEREWEERLKEVKVDRKKIEAKYEKVQKQYGDASLKWDSAETELRAMRIEFDKAGTDLIDGRNAVKYTDNAIQARGKTEDELETAITKLDRTKICPTCGQAVKLKNLAEHRQELEKQLSECKSELVKSNNRFLGLKSTVVLLEKKVEKCREYKQDFQNKADESRSAMDRLQPEVAGLKAQIEGLKGGLKEKEAEQNPHKKQMRDLRSRKTKLKDEIEDLERRRDIVLKKVERHRFWIKGFKQVKLYMLEEMLEELTIVTNGMLDDVGLGGWEVQYAVERETKSGNVQRGLTVQIKSLTSQGFVKWESWSGGEGQRLRVVGALALAEVLLNHAGVQPNLEIIDEQTKYLPPDGVRDVCDFLADRARTLKKSIWLVDHQAVEAAHFTSVVTVVKDKKGSYILEDESK